MAFLRFARTWCRGIRAARKRDIHEDGLTREATPA